MIKFVFLLLTLVGTSCGNYEQVKQYRVVKNFNKQIARGITVEDAFSHFPQRSELILLNSLFSIPLRNIVKGGNRRAIYSIVICELNAASFSLPHSFIFKRKYSESDNFIVSRAFREDIVFAENHDIYYPGSYPIPSLDYFDFGLGGEVMDTIVNGREYVYDKHYLPLDLEAYVLEAEHGIFWKAAYGAPAYRPERMKEWKHGYSKGIAISAEEKIVVYWTMVW